MKKLIPYLTIALLMAGLATAFSYGGNGGNAVFSLEANNIYVQGDMLLNSHGGRAGGGASGSGTSGGLYFDWNAVNDIILDGDGTELQFDWNDDAYLKQSIFEFSSELTLHNTTIASDDGNAIYPAINITGTDAKSPKIGFFEYSNLTRGGTSFFRVFCDNTSLTTLRYGNDTTVEAPDSDIAFTYCNATIVYQDWEFYDADLTIHAHDWETEADITNFSVHYDGTIYNSTVDGEVFITYTAGTAIDFNITSEGYYNVTKTSYNKTEEGNLDQAMMNSSFSDLINITILSPTGETIETVTVTVNGTNKGQVNPWQESPLNYFNSSDPETSITLNITVTDLARVYDTQSQLFTITPTTLNQSMTLGVVTYTLWFFHDTTLTSIDGFCGGGLTTPQRIDFNTTTNFTWDSNDFDLSTTEHDSVIRCELNVEEPQNNTNYYEFINEGLTTDVNESIQILAKQDYYIYIRVYTGMLRPVENAQIRMYMQNQTTYETFEDLLFAGQRITNAGETFFWADTGTVNLFEVSAEGYKTEYRPVVIGDEQYDGTKVLLFFLEPSTTEYESGVTIHAIEEIESKNLAIPIVIEAHGKETISINTQYQIDLGITTKTFMTEDPLQEGYWTVNITPGVHFSSSTTDNITIYAYADSSTTQDANKTITYTGPATNGIFARSLLSGYTTTTVNLILTLAILATCFLLGILFKGAELGKGTYFIAIIIASGASVSFLWVALILFMEQVFNYIKEVISE